MSILFATLAVAAYGADPIQVNHEWDPLRVAIVGRADELIVPSWHKSCSFSYGVLDKELMEKYGGMAWQDVDSAQYDTLNRQLENYVTLLEGLGVTVLRMGPYDEASVHYGDNVQRGLLLLYPRDPLLVIGNHVIETSLKVPFRAKERWGARKAFDAYRDTIAKYDPKSQYRYVSMPFPDPAYPENGCYLEGGDVLLNGKQIYVGVSGNASNEAGVNWLRNYLGKSYKIHVIKISGEFQHLDCVMSMPRPGLMVACLDAIDMSTLPKHLRGWDVIDVSIADAKKLACNMMIVDTNKVIVNQGFPEITKQLRDTYGMTVIEVPFDAVTTWDGGFRCNHHPLLRGKKSPPAAKNAKGAAKTND